MVICWIDVGAKGAIVIKNTKFPSYITHKHSFSKWMVTTYSFITWFFKWLSDNKPDVIIIGEAMWMKATVKMHSKYYWIIELIAEQMNIPVIYCNDLQTRKAVLIWPNYYSSTEKTKAWSYKVLTWKQAKQWVMNHFKETDSDIADAKLFIEWYLKAIWDWLE